MKCAVHGNKYLKELLRHMIDYEKMIGVLCGY